MSDYISDFEILLGKAVKFYGQLETISFPDSEKLGNVCKVKPPDLAAYFQEGMDIYRSLDHNLPESKMLIRAALCFDLSYEIPPSEICMAVVKLLILSGDYENACLYALEFLTVAEVQRLMFEHMPLCRNGSYHISHLMLPCWQPETALAILMRELRKHEPEERKGFIQSLLHWQGEVRERPQPLLEAVCAFLYVEKCRGKTKEEIREINNLVLEYGYAESAEVLLQHYYRSVNDSYCRSFWSKDCIDWDDRWDKFHKYYAGGIKKGFFVYCPGMQGAVVLHIRLRNTYELSETETALAGKDLQISLNRNFILKADYMKHRGKFRLLNPQRLKFEEIKKIAERLRVFIRLGISRELESHYWDFIKCYETQSTLESADQYKLFAENTERLLNIFNRYKQIKWHDHKRALEIIRLLIERCGARLQGNHYMTFFNYYMQFREYNKAEKFVIQYKNELGETYYPQAYAQLQGHRRDVRKNSGASLKKPAVKTKWHPLPLKEGYGNYVTFFLRKGEALLDKKQGKLDGMSEKELWEEHDRIIQHGDERSENPMDAAEYFLMAGVVLNKRREWFCCMDTDELFAEDMIDAFYHYSRSEMKDLNIDHDMMHSYQEQALHLSGRLHPDYLNPSLKNTFEEMLKRYFKDRPGHDDDSLAEAVRYMAKKSSVSDEEFGNCLMRLSLYYPNFLTRADIIKLLQTNEEVKHRLAEYMRLLDWNPEVDAGMIGALQECRDRLVEEFNNCDFMRQTDNAEVQKEELKKGLTHLQEFKGRGMLYGILSKSDHEYIEKLMELLTNPPQEDASYLLVKEYKKKCTDLLESIEQKPTSFAVEQLYIPAQALEEHSELRRKRLYEKLNPVFSAEALFAERNPSDNDRINIYLQIGCSGGMSGLQKVSVHVLGSEYVAEGEDVICSYVEENGKEYGFLGVFIMRPEAVRESLSFEADFQFMIEKTREKKSVRKEFHIPMESLTLKENYEQMYHPGSALYEGHTMAKYTFYGRNHLIERICSKFYDFPNSMVVLYGQRKVGKTTIANYVASSIKKSGRKILVVNCGNSNITLYNKEKKDCTEEIIQDFYAGILENLASEIERDRRGRACFPNEIMEMKKAAARKNRVNVKNEFCGLIRNLHDAFECEECWRGTRILLWFDEFQQYYLSILNGRLQSDFVGFLKAFIEQNSFSFLLVGCEPMLPFVRDIRFGNTFSAAEQIHVEYLPMEYAKKLICDPIPQKSGRENPFKFVADEIFRLSAGSPYFIQLICKNLIDGLNEKRKVFADKKMILDSLHKDGKVMQINFDSLYASLNFQGSSPDDNNRVLKKISYRQKERIGSTRRIILEDLKDVTVKPAEEVLDELISRKVVEESNGELRIVVRLYEEWNWENRMELGYDGLPEL